MLAPSPYRISIGVNIDAAGAKSGSADARRSVAEIGAEAERATPKIDKAAVSIEKATTAGATSTVPQTLTSIGAAADQATTKMQRLANAFAGIQDGPANQNIREWTGALAAQGKSIDDLRAKYNPLFAVIREYKANLTEIRTLQAQGVLTTDEMTAAIARQRQAALASIDAIKGRNNALMAGAANQNFNTSNIAFQLFDTIQTAPYLSPGMVGFQQGPQFAQGFAGMNLREVGTTLTAAASQIVSPISLAAIGFTTAAAAAIHYGGAVFDSTNKAEEVLEKHEATLKRIRDLSNDAADGRSRYGQSIQGSIAFTANRDRYLLENQLRDQLREVGSDVGFGTRGPTALFQQNYGPLAETVLEFRKQALLGRGDVKAFNDEIVKLANQDPSNRTLQEKAARLLEITKNATESAAALHELNKELLDNTLVSARTNAAAAAANYNRQNNEAEFYLRRQQEAAIFGIGARSPVEIAEATRRRLEADPVDPEREDAPRRALRIDNEVQLARLHAERQLKDAQDQRVRSLNSSVEAQRLDLSLIGKTVGEAERLRREYQLTEQLREEAARNNTEIDETELALISEKAAELGKLAQLRASAGLLADAQFEREQLGRTPGERQIAAQLRSTFGTVDINSYEAGILRANEALRQQVGAWEEIRNTGRDAIDDIVDSASEGFEDIDDVLKNIGKDITKQLLTLGVGNPIKSALYGDQLPTIGTAGGVGGFFGALFGGKSPAAGLGSSTSAMAVNAGTVMINGGVSNPFDALLKGSNDNGGAGSVQSQVWNFFAGKGLKPHQIAGVMGNVSGESAFNPRAIGDGGNALGLFQHNDRAPALLSFLGGRGNLGNVQGQLDFAWHELQTSESSVLKRLLASTDVRSATAAFAGFERPRGWSLENPEASHNFIGRLRGAEDALTRFGGTTNVAAQGLGTLGTGFDQFGKNLTSLFPAAPSAPSGGGGGLFGWLGKLFGGTSLSSALSASPQFASAWAAGGIGLYDVGGPTGGSDPSRIAGLVHEKEYVFDARSTAAIGVHNLEALRRNALQGGKGGYDTGGYVTSVAPIYAGAWRGNGQAYGGSARSAPIINNYGTSNVEYEETTDERGNRQPIITIGEMSAAAVRQRGNPLRRAMQSEFGSTPRRIAR